LDILGRLMQTSTQPEDRALAHLEAPNKLLDLIYDAATEPELWCSAMAQIAGLLHSQGGIIFGQSMNARGASEVHFDHNGGLCDECNRAYQERHLENAWSVAMHGQPVGRVVFSDEVVPLPSLRRTPFFAEVLRPQGAAHNAMPVNRAKVAH
jgi:hypothetical protein